MNPWCALRRLAGAVEQAIGEVAARAVVWIGPLPTAYLVYRAALALLEWPVWLAIATAGVVELLNIAALGLALDCRQFNQTRRSGEPPAYTWAALLAVFFYLAIALTMTAMIELYAHATQFINLAFPFVSIVAATIIALRRDLNKRLEARAAVDTAAAAERERARAERKERRKEMRDAETFRKVSGKFPEGDWRKISPDQRAGMVDMTSSEIAGMFNVSERTARSWRARAGGNGKDGDHE